MATAHTVEIGEWIKYEIGQELRRKSFLKIFLNFSQNVDTILRKFCKLFKATILPGSMFVLMMKLFTKSKMRHPK